MRSLLVILSMSAAVCSYGQEAVVSSGGDATGSGGSASFTVGQPSYTYTSSSDGSVSEGVQQTYQITSSTGITENSRLTLKAYPNPTADVLILTTEGMETESEDLKYNLFDSSGKLVLSSPVNSNTTRINMQNLATGTYFLSVSGNEELTQTFTINKIQ